MKRLYLLFALAACLPHGTLCAADGKQKAVDLATSHTGSHGRRPSADERNRRAEDEVRLARTEREHRPLDGRHSDVQFVRIRQEYGRATLSTVAFRGTSPSHTQVTWNGMRINNPMLGMTDFSTIPSYFIDDASLLHGTSSVNETGGGLGGLVKLSTAPTVAEGFDAAIRAGHRIVPDIRRVRPLHLWQRERWHVSTRAVYSSSPNDYKYTNHDKKINIYDEEKNIIGQYHPKERNRSGAFKDLHLLQEVYYNTRKGDKLGLNAWYINSNRELPMLTTDYGDDNRLREPPAGTHPAQCPFVGSLSPELETRRERRLRAHVDGLRLPARRCN